MGPELHTRVQVADELLGATDVSPVWLALAAELAAQTGQPATTDLEV